MNNMHVFNRKYLQGEAEGIRVLKSIYQHETKHLLANPIL